mmetsp:Transcript_12068/g.26405  ORF Transcript_12068/g.26405 Transcript_12068/m.26405 type:complete len:282 (+) Transcript_12068:227-1072(+)
MSNNLPAIYQAEVNGLLKRAKRKSYQPDECSWTQKLFHKNADTSFTKRIDEARVYENLDQRNYNLDYEIIIDDFSKMLIDRYSILQKMGENRQNSPQGSFYFENDNLIGDVAIKKHFKLINDRICLLKNQAFSLISKMKNEAENVRVPERKKSRISPETEYERFQLKPPLLVIYPDEENPNVNVLQDTRKRTNLVRGPVTDSTSDQQENVTRETRINFEKEIPKVKDRRESLNESFSSCRDYGSNAEMDSAELKTDDRYDGKQDVYVDEKKRSIYLHSHRK